MLLPESSAAAEALLQLDRAANEIHDAGPGLAHELLLVVHEALVAELGVDRVEEEEEVHGVVAEPGVDVVGLDVLADLLERVGVDARAVRGVEHAHVELLPLAELLVDVAQDVAVVGPGAEAVREVRARLGVHKKNGASSRFGARKQRDPCPWTRPGPSRAFLFLCVFSC